MARKIKSSILFQLKNSCMSFQLVFAANQVQRIHSKVETEPHTVDFLSAREFLCCVQQLKPGTQRRI